MQNDTRTAFERWYVAQYGFDAPVALNCDEHSGMTYVNSNAECHWRGWQASRADLLERMKSGQMVEKVSLKLARKAWGNDDPQMGSPLEVSQRDNAKSALAAIIEETKI